ncbi:MAG TPA: polysaccharide biosynthesis C-terminal domain-containing protein [Puia sp.]
MELRRLIFQNILWRGLYFISAFILNIVVARLLNADGSGEVFYIINNLSLTLLVIGLSLESGATYYIAKHEIDNSKIAFFLFFWSLIGTAISILFFHWIINDSVYISNFRWEYITGCVCYISGFLFITYFSALFFAKHDFFVSNFILFCVNLLMIAFFILTNNQSFIHQHFIIIYFSSFLLQGLALMLIYFFKNVSFKNIKFLSGAEFKKLFSYSLLALLSNLIFFLVYRVDYWFVKKFCTESDLGNYIQVSKIGQMFFVLPSIIGSVIFPIISAGQQQVKTKLKAIALALLLLYFVLCVILIAAGKWLFPHIYGNSFEKMYSPFLFSIPGILSLSMLYPFTAYFSGKKRIDINLKGALLALVLIVAGDIIFIPRYGISGAALISSFGYILYQFYVMFFFAKEYKVSVASLFSVSSGELNKLYSIIVKDFFNANNKNGKR